MRRELIGSVIRDKNLKTRIVEVSIRKPDPKYGKVVKYRRKFHCHDEKNVSHTGDRVLISECRPLSRLKRWKIEKVLQTPQKI